MKKPDLSILHICNMSIGFMGIQFGWGLQMANMSAIYEYLGANPDKIPILWLAAPLTGLIIQPIIGHLSDNTWCWLGRRRPYFLIGAILATFALFLMPYSGTLWMAAGLLWVLDSSVNISMEPFRAFVADMLPEKQRTVGYSIQTLFVSIGAVTASAFPWMLQNIFNIKDIPPSPHPLAVTAAAHGSSHHVLSHMPLLNRIPDILQDKLPHIIKISFHVGAAVFISAVLWTVITCREYPPENKKTGKNRRAVSGFFKEIVSDLLNMPKTMRELAWVQFFTWMAMFCLWMYFPVTVGHLFGKENSPQYLDGIEWAGICFAAYNVVTLFYSFFMPKIALLITRKKTHFISLLFGAAGMLGVLLLRGSDVASLKKLVLLLMVGLGIAWGSILTMPYAMLSAAIPKSKMGIYMGIFNFFITLPQITISLGFGWIMLNVLGNNRAMGVVFGGFCMIIAALLTLRVKDRGAEKERGYPESWVSPGKKHA